MKYFKNENNEIFAYDAEQIGQGLDKDKIKITEDEMLVITNPPKTSEELETERILSIDSKTGEIIYSKYSREKQFNIGHLLYPYTEQDREEMFRFIEIVRAIGREARDSGMDGEDIDWLEIDKRIALIKQGI